MWWHIRPCIWHDQDCMRSRAEPTRRRCASPGWRRPPVRVPCMRTVVLLNLLSFALVAGGVLSLAAVLVWGVKV